MFVMLFEPQIQSLLKTRRWQLPHRLPDSLLAFRSSHKCDDALEQGFIAIQRAQASRTLFTPYQRTAPSNVPSPSSHCVAAVTRLRAWRVKLHAALFLMS